jgi:FeS assembly SUF system protein
MDNNTNLSAENLVGQGQAPADLEERIIDVLRTCYDPEIPVNIYELGLIYNIEIDPEANVNVQMTLTSPGCPVAGSLPGEVQSKVGSVMGVKSAKVDLVWDPAWRPDRMSEAAKLQLGML